MTTPIRSRAPTLIAPTLIALSLISLTLVSRPAAVRADGACRRVRATIDLGQGTIHGNAGLDGTVAFTPDSAGTPPATAPGGSSVFSGTLVITTDRGTLSMRETGMSSQRTGNPEGSVLSSWGDSMTGTDRFEGSSGLLFFAGRRTPEGLFLVAVRGRLCGP